MHKKTKPIISAADLLDLHLKQENIEKAKHRATIFTGGTDNEDGFTVADEGELV